MNELGTLAARVKAMMQKKGFNQSSLAAACGVAQPSVAKWLSGETKILRSTTALNLAKVLGVNLLWLTEGKGRPEDVVLDPFASTAPEGTKKIPLLSYVQAGLFSDVGDIDADEYIVVSDDVSDRAFALKIRGDSMMPDYRQGDLIVIDPDLEPYPSDNVVAQTEDGETTFKRYRVTGRDNQGRTQFDLVPLNPDFPTYHSTDRDIRILGVEVEHRRYKKRIRS
jgi:SOS-response transcriptional repressor LexA